MSLNYLKIPARKVVAKSLKFSTESRPADETSGERHLWTCKLPNRCFTLLPVVWVQGFVVQILSTSSVIIDDGTGTIRLTDCDKLCSKVELTTGMYIMVVGRIQSVGQNVAVSCMKIQDLSGDDNAVSMWFLEVIDQMNYLQSSVLSNTQVNNAEQK